MDGTLTNNGQLALDLHDVTQSATLTATGGFQNNGGFNFEANSVLNANVTNGGASNASANFSAQNGAGTLVTLNNNMDNFAGVNLSSLGGAGSTLTENGDFTNETTGTLTVVGSNLTINGTGTAFNNAGNVSITEDVNGPTVPISHVGITGGVINQTTGTITMEDAAVTVTGDVDNNGTVNIKRDSGHVNVASNVTVNGTLTNETGANLTVANSTLTVSGPTTNNGTVNVTNVSTMWFGTSTNNGAYHSEPSTNTFTNLIEGANGYLTGTSGDVFRVTGNFINDSTQNTLGDTSASTLEFSTGTRRTHEFGLAGLDMGAVSTGFIDNFAWDLPDLDSGNTLDLESTSTTFTNALYVSMLEGLTFSGDDISNIFGDGLNIYYNPTDDTGLNDEVFALENGGYLCPIGASRCTLSTSQPPTGVPEPSSALLFGAGLAGLAAFAGCRRRHHVA